MKGERGVVSTLSVLPRVRGLMRSAKRFSGTLKSVVLKLTVLEPLIIILGWPLTGFFLSKEWV